MISALNCPADDILAGIGPGIRACHFEIKPDVLEEFNDYPLHINFVGQKIFVDLPAIITSQLTAAGVLKQNIADSGHCTYCQKDKYFSFRRDHPKKVRAMVAYIGLI